MTPALKLKPLPQGTALARYVALAAKHRGNLRAAETEAIGRFPDTPQVARALGLAKPRLLDEDDIEVRAAVAAGTMDGWGSPLARSGVLDDFLPLANAASALGQIRAKAREIPFATSAATVSSTATAAWVGEGGTKPASSFTLQGTTLEPRKLVSFVVVSRACPDVHACGRACYPSGVARCDHA